MSKMTPQERAAKRIADAEEKEQENAQVIEAATISESEKREKRLQLEETMKSGGLFGKRTTIIQNSQPATSEPAMESTATVKPAKKKRNKRAPKNGVKQRTAKASIGLMQNNKNFIKQLRIDFAHLDPMRMPSEALLVRVCLDFCEETIEKNRDKLAELTLRAYDELSERMVRTNNDDE